MSVSLKREIELEVRWYREHGKHKDRIRIDILGDPYVVCDWSWNKANRYRQERIGRQLTEYIQERVTGIKA